MRLDARHDLRRHETREEEDERFTTSLAGLAVVLFLAVIGLYLVEQLAAESRLEDCVMGGRLNCATLDLMRTTKF